MSLIDPDRYREDLIFNMTCCPFSQLYRMLAQAMAGSSGYRKEDIEEAIREKINLPIFQNGTIIRLDFPPNTPTAIRERVVQIHAEVCKRWGCDPSWTRDPKA